MLWFYITFAERKTMCLKTRENTLGEGANLDTKVFYCLPLNPLHRDPNPNSPQLQTWALCMPLPKSPACERNRTPGLLVAHSLFSESQQLPLTGSFSPALPPPAPEHLPGSSEDLGLLALSSLRVSCLPPCSPASRGSPPCPPLPSFFTPGFLLCRPGLQT